MRARPHSPEPILDRLKELHPKVIDLSLDRIARLLEALGRPQDRLPPVVHVAGTNGKGSVVALLRAVLEAADYRVHAYTSPHLVRFNERIRLAGRLIADTDLSGVLAECEAANGGEPITFFEITTAAAFLAFARAEADVVLLETGLGGRLDATNMVARPAVVVLTPVSIDHQQFLGQDLAAIAAEKAAILKPGVAAVVGPQPAAAAAVIEARARAVDAPLLRHGAEWSVAVGGAGMIYRGRRWHLDLPAPVLPGLHQVDNAGTALAVLEALNRFRIDEQAVRRGLADVDWPGRLQRLQGGRLAGLLPGDWELWLDGGHNAAAAEALAATLRQWPRMRLEIVLGMMRGKDPRAFLRPFAGLAAGVRGVAVPGEEAAWAAEEICAAAEDEGLVARSAESVGAALADIAAAGGEPARVLICGSLYLAGTVLAENR